MEIERQVGEYSGLTYKQLLAKIYDIPHLVKYVNALFDNEDNIVIFSDDLLWDVETHFGDDGGTVVAIYEPDEDLPELPNLNMNGWSTSDVHESYNELFGGFDYERVTVSSGEVLVVLDECDYIAIHLLDTDKIVDGIVDNTCRHFGGWKKMYPHLVVSK